LEYGTPSGKAAGGTARSVELVQRRRSATAAKRFFRKLLKGLRYVPRVIVTDKLKSYVAARREILPSVEHRHRWSSVRRVAVNSKRRRPCTIASTSCGLKNARLTRRRMYRHERRAPAMTERAP
jgi:putative transposase